jgi:integrase
MSNLGMELKEFDEEDFLNQCGINSSRSKTVAKTSITIFNDWCVEQGYTKERVIEQYLVWFNNPKPDVRKICLSLNNFVIFLTKEKILINGTTSKAKSPKTIMLYLSFIKSYLRKVHDIKLTSEDFKDYITIPKVRKEQRRPISIIQLKQIMNNASPQRRALYYTLISSGMRLGEALSLTKKNFHFDEMPVRITLEAENTKTKESRETFISSEAVEKIRPLIEFAKEDDNFFVVSQIKTSKDLAYYVSNEDRVFGFLRKKLNMLEKYPNSSRYTVNLHSFRAYFHTKASQKHGSDYANALDGHGAYLKQYYREDPKERAKKYLELESSLLIESVKIEADQVNAKLMSDMQDQLVKMQDEIDRLKKYPQAELFAQ